VYFEKVEYTKEASKMRKKIEAGIKARVALEAIKGAMTIAEISTKFSLHPNMVIRWKRDLLENAAGIFDHKKDQETVEAQEKIDDLHKNIGELTMERDWLKKNCRFCRNRRQEEAL